MKKVPVCPNCKTRLVTVSETSWVTYVWNGREYVAELGSEESEARCLNCSANVSELFPDGICNY